MITEVNVKGLRGIAEGRLTGLTALTVLVGPNGCGKSTVLDALLLGASVDRHEDALEQVVDRRRGTATELAWLLYKYGDCGPAKVVVGVDNGDRAEFAVEEASNNKIAWHVEPAGIGGSVSGRPGQAHLKIGQIADTPLLGNTGIVRMIEPGSRGIGRALDVSFSSAIRRGFRRQVQDLLRSVIPGMESIEILSDENRRPVVHFVYEWGSVPLGLVGDGVVSLARLCFELASCPGGLALVEEPEVHQHPRAITQSASALVEATRRDVQVVVSTHSLELIDALIDALEEDEIDRFSVQRLSLQAGKLTASCSSGQDAMFARHQIEEDLR